MQECFRRHPDHYGGEFEDSDGQEDEAENPAANNPQVDESSTSPVLEPVPRKSPEVDEPSVPLYQSKTPFSAVSPQVDEPSFPPATSSVSEGSQTTSDHLRKAPEGTKGQDRGLRNLEPYQQSEGDERLVPDANHDSLPPS